MNVAIYEKDFTEKGNYRFTLYNRHKWVEGMKWHTAQDLYRCFWLFQTEPRILWKARVKKREPNHLLKPCENVLDGRNDVCSIEYMNIVKRNIAP